jgi:putative membrane protein
MKHWIISAFLVLSVAACAKHETTTVDTDTGATTDTMQTTSDTANTMTTASAASTLSAEDTDFVNKAAMGGLAEVQLGNLATQKAQNADVKSFGQRMVTDHSAANAELSQLATAKGITLPTEIAGEHKAAADHLNTESGAAFDKAYMTHMVEDHNKDVAEFEKASQSAQDADVKAWAAKTLPTLKAHQELAKSTSAKLK